MVRLIPWLCTSVRLIEIARCANCGLKIITILATLYFICYILLDQASDVTEGRYGPALKKRALHNSLGTRTHYHYTYGFDAILVFSFLWSYHIFSVDLMCKMTETWSRNLDYIVQQSNYILFHAIVDILISYFLFSTISCLASLRVRVDFVMIEVLTQRDLLLLIIKRHVDFILLFIQACVVIASFWYVFC
jgi:hypothetical protein